MRGSYRRHTHAPQYTHTHTHIVRQKVNRKFVIVFLFSRFLCASISVSILFSFSFASSYLVSLFNSLSPSRHFLSLFYILFDILISGGLLVVDDLDVQRGEGGSLGGRGKLN